VLFEKQKQLNQSRISYTTLSQGFSFFFFALHMAQHQKICLLCGGYQFFFFQFDVFVLFPCLVPTPKKGGNIKLCKMAMFQKHMTFLHDVWGLDATTLDAFCKDAVAKAEANAAPFDDSLFVFHRLEAHKARGTDPVEVLEELVALGPCVYTLFQMTVYINFTATPVIAVPRSKEVTKASQEFRDDDGNLSSVTDVLPVVVANDRQACTGDSLIDDSNGSDERGGDVPDSDHNKNGEPAEELSTSAAADGVVGHSEAMKAEEDDVGAGEVKPQPVGEDPDSLPHDCVVVDQCTLEMALFTMWIHGLTPAQLSSARLMDPATVFVPLKIHNEIVLLFSVLRGLLENGCESIALFDDAIITERYRQEHQQQPPPTSLSVKDILAQVCLRYDVTDNNYWRAESTLLSMLIHTFRMCYAMATNVDEEFQFSNGAVTLTIAQILIELLDFPVGLQFSECLYGLANQMLAHQTPRLMVRGRLITPYDLLAMIRLSQSQVENQDSFEASKIIDARPRGRVHASCFLRSEPNSNHIVNATVYWRRVVVASVCVLIGGLCVSRQATRFA
jgi:hypothetical protein